MEQHILKLAEIGGPVVAGMIVTIVGIIYLLRVMLRHHSEQMTAERTSASENTQRVVDGFASTMADLVGEIRSGFEMQKSTSEAVVEQIGNVRRDVIVVKDRVGTSGTQ